MVDAITPNQYAAGGPFEQLDAFCGGLPQGINNLVAVTDPVAGSDNTLGYRVGSAWVNTANGRVWFCVSAATGAATWALAVVPGVGVEPANNLEQFGGGTGTMLSEGNINRQLSVAGVQPGTTANDNVLAFFSLPAGSLDALGRGLTITAQGSFAATNNAKRLKLIFNATTAVVGSAVTGGTTIADTGSLTTTSNAGGWSIQANVFKTGALGSNTQLGLHQLTQPAAVLPTAPAAIAAVESGAILIAVTGAAATATTDITFNFLEINAMN